MRVSELTQTRKGLEIDFERETLNLVYNPAIFTPEFEDRLEAETAGADGKFRTSVLARMIAELLVEWDLLNEDGTPFGETYEVLRTLPVVVLGAIAQAVAEDMSGETRAEGKDSDATSPPEESSAGSLVGTT